MGQRFEPGPVPSGARLVAQKRGIAEYEPGGAAGFFGRHAGGEIFCDLTVEVEAEFIVELGRCGPATKEHGEFSGEEIEPAHRLAPGV